MRRNPYRPDELPEVNLVPMLDVMMSVLTFFIIITMSFSGQVIQNIENPQAKDQIDAEVIIEGPMLIGVNHEGQIIFEGEVVSLGEVREITRRYLRQNPEGGLILKADRNLDYQEVAQVLEALAEEGSDRISLTITP